MSKEQDLRLLEALLFASSEPLTPHVMRERVGEDVDLGALLSDLQQHYQSRGVNLMEFDGNWAFRTAPDLADMLAVHKDVPRKLSRAAMETLSIIAYHQPVTRAEIENVRGVATSKGTLDVLLEANWIKPGRRRETPGRPLTWVTTTAFMDQFGLESMTDLPGLDDLKASGLLDRRPAIDTLPSTGDMFEDADDGSEDDTENEVDARAERALENAMQQQDEPDEDVIHSAKAAQDDDFNEDDNDINENEEEKVG